MQLKPGTKGIIVRPTPCCGSTMSIGIMLEFVEYSTHGLTGCVYCGNIDEKTTSTVRCKNSSGLFVTLKQRVKWFNDDLDLEDTTEEEVTKEIQNAAV